jgi:hypothetical protein
MTRKEDVISSAGGEMSIGTFVQTIVRIVCSLTAIVWWRARQKTVGRRKPRLTEDELLRFFDDRANFAERQIAEIELVLGPWSDCDDWDWGRLMYDWDSGGLRVRVRTKNDIVVCVDYYKRGRGARFDVPDQTIWQKPEKEGHGSP